MRRAVVFFAVMMTAAGSALAQQQQSHVTIGGVDSRQAPLEAQALQALLNDQSSKTAHIAALYQMEKEDHDADKKALEAANASVQWWSDPANRAWVDAKTPPQAK